jgi:hypothetical protein
MNTPRDACSYRLLLKKIKGMRLTKTLREKILNMVSLVYMSIWPYSLKLSCGNHRNFIMIRPNNGPVKPKIKPTIGLLRSICFKYAARYKARDTYFVIKDKKAPQGNILTG